MSKTSYLKFHVVFATMGYVILAGLFTFPLIMHITTHLAGCGGDVLQFVWGFWHMQQKLIQGVNPFWASEIFHPINVNLMLHTWTPIKSLMAQLLLPFFSLITTYNILFLFSYIMTGLGSYFFLCTFDLDKRAAFIGGVLIAFSPNQMGHGYGHLNLISIEAIPWLFYVWRLRNLNKYLSACLLALLGAYLFSSDYNLFVFVGLLVGIYLIYQWQASKKALGVALKRMIPAGIVFMILLLPFWVMAAKELHNYAAMNVHGERWGDAEKYGNNILSFLLPSPFHPWWGAAAQKMAAQWNVVYNGVENVGFFGYLASAFAIVGMVKFWRNRTMRFWIISGISFLMLSLGPFLLFGPITLNAASQFKIFSFNTIKVIFPLPYTLIHYLPFVNGARIPGRFVLMAFIAFAVLAAMTLNLISRSAAIHSPLKKMVFYSIVFIGMIIEYLPLPFPSVPISVPEMYKVIRDDKNLHAVVLDLPSPPWAWQGIQPLYYQTFHGHDIVGGWTARESKEQHQYFFKYHVIKLVGLCDPAVSPGEFGKIIDNLNITYIPVRGKTVIEELDRLSKSIPGLKKIMNSASQEAALWKYEKPQVQ